MASLLTRSTKGAATDSGDGSSSDSSSASGQEDEYVVNSIIAQCEPEDGEDGEGLYLVRWEGYPDNQCTWEPRESFLSDETLDQWRRDRAENRTLIQEQMGSFAEAEEQQRRQRMITPWQGSGKSATSNPVPTSSSRKPLPTSQGPRNPAGSRTSAEHYGSTPAATSDQHPDTRPSHTAEPARRSFLGMGIVTKARRSLHPTQPTKPSGSLGTHFKTLRTQNRYQKASKTERAPDPGKLILRSPAEFIAAAGEDVAHILPTGHVRPAMSLNAGQQQQSASASTQKTVALQVTPVIASSRSTIPRSTSYAAPSQSLHRIQQRPPRINANREDPDFRFSKNGRYWYKGELVVHMRFGEHLVGDVRLAGIHSTEFSHLIYLKSGDRVSLDFLRENMVTRDQYENLCKGVLHLLTCV